MRSERALGTLSRVVRRLSFVGIAAGLAASALWNGCAGSNTDYMGNIVDGGSDDGPPPGSDLTCLKTPDPDVPDSMFVDNNCDGIDGDASNAIFASPNGDDTFAGTRENPVKTIPQAIKLAQQQSKAGVYLDKGIYAGSVTLVAGINVYGGYDSGNLWSRGASNESLIQGGTTAVTASNIAAETHLELVTVTSASGATPGQSSYGLFVVNSQGPLVIRNSIIRAGDGAAGTDGTVGTVGATGGNGGNGQNACSDCNGPPAGGTPGAAGKSSCGRDGGIGGTGNQGTGGGGANGVNNPNSGGGGGKDGTCLVGPNNNPGGNGGSAPVAGANGSNGPAASNLGTANASGYAPAGGGSGVNGQPGSGGGGGGAGGGGGGGLFCKEDTGGGGGGGGAGGCGATAGLGGGGGGASVGLYAYMSKVTLYATDVSSGRGGNGGKGGNGFAGGAGGAGGQGGGPADEAGRGGNGGAGSGGGTSGAGSGGTGGPSFGTWSVSSTIADPSQNCTFATKMGGGTGGAAGTAPLPLGQAIPGSNGLSAGQR